MSVVGVGNDIGIEFGHREKTEATTRIRSTRGKPRLISEHWISCRRARMPKAF